MKPRLSGAFPLAALMGEIGPMGLGDNASCLTIELFIIVKGEEEGIERWSHAVLSRCDVFARLDIDVVFESSRWYLTVVVVVAAAAAAAAVAVFSQRYFQLVNFSLQSRPRFYFSRDTSKDKCRLRKRPSEEEEEDAEKRQPEMSQSQK
jgi:hypothetical protein